MCILVMKENVCMPLRVRVKLHVTYFVNILPCCLGLGVYCLGLGLGLEGNCLGLKPCCLGLGLWVYCLGHNTAYYLCQIHIAMPRYQIL